jgi:hypothetical protein
VEGGVHKERVKRDGECGGSILYLCMETEMKPVEIVLRRVGG